MVGVDERRCKFGVYFVVEVGDENFYCVCVVFVIVLLDVFVEFSVGKDLVGFLYEELEDIEFVG